MKKVYILGLVLILMFSVSACAANPAGSEETKLEKITVVLDWVPNTNHTGLYAAKDLGYFKDEGLDVEIVSPPEDGAEVLVAANRAQFGISVQENVINAMTSDESLPIKGVATLVNHNTSGIISLKSKGIETPKDLEGKKYATWDAPIEKAMIKDIVTKDGGDFSKVEMIPSTVTDEVSALQTNVDAIWVFYGWGGIATEVAGLETNYLSFKDINPIFDYYTPIIISNDEFLKNNPETVRKFLAAAAKGYEYSINNPEAAAEILLKSAPEIDREMAMKSQEYLKGQYKAEEAVWGKFDEKRWSDFADWLYSEGIISRKLDAGEGFTNEFLGE